MRLKRARQNKLKQFCKALFVCKTNYNGCRTDIIQQL